MSGGKEPGVRREASVGELGSDVAPVSSRRRRRWAIPVVALLLGVSELVARYGAGLGDPPLSMVDTETEYRFVPGVYHRFGRTISYNLFSMRSGPVSPHKLDPNELRVLVVGDSIINGGALTDDKEIATTLLEGRLAAHFGRPVRVCNISAGSWGPPNEAAYLQKFGWFDADALVLVASSHDGTDAPTYDPVVGQSLEFPDHKPWCALWDGFTRYTPPGRWLSAPPVASFAAQPEPPDGPAAARQCRVALDAIYDHAAALHVPTFFVINWERPEVDAGRLNPPAKVLLDAAAGHGVPLLDLGVVQAKALKAGRDPYRDFIHPNVLGQKLLADLIEPSLTAALENSATTRPVTP